MKQAIVISCILLGLAAPAVFATNLRVMDLNAQHHPLQHPRFTGINASGHLSITIVPVKNSSAVSFSVQDLQHGQAPVIAEIRQHMLYLRQIGYSTRATAVTVYMHDINELDVFGRTELKTQHLNSSGLNLRVDTAGIINLDGLITLKQLSVSGNSKINLRWVRGNNVTLYSHGHSRINIAGNIGILRAKLFGHSFLNARYLRTQQTWIKTRDFAQAQVIASDALQAYPTDHSNIYYYKSPNLLNPINSAAGNTLQLGWDE